MKPSQKKAFIGQVMLGIFLISTIFVFVATVADDQKARNEVLGIKKLVQSAAMASAKYYAHENDDTDDAEAIAKDIVGQTKLGAKIKDNLVFTWDTTSDPQWVKVKVEDYKVDFFWYKLLGLNDTNVDKIESKANIITVENSATDALPIALNGCDQTYTEGEVVDLILDDSDEPDYSKHGFFYRFTEQFASKFGGVDSFTNSFQNMLGETDDVALNSFGATMGLNDFNTANTTVAVVDCNGNVVQHVEVKQDYPDCSKSCCISMGISPMSVDMCMPMFCMFANLINSFNFPFISATTRPCDGSFMMRFTIVNTKEKKVVLEY